MWRRLRADAVRLAIVVGVSGFPAIAGCSGYEPMDVPDQRENPSFPGLFTGKDGEWVIYRKKDLPDPPEH